MYRGGVKLKPSAARFNSIHIGYHAADAVDVYSAHTILNIEKNGHIVFGGTAHIGHGANIHCKRNAELSLGDNFAISGTTGIICSSKITIGDNVQFSWNTLVMDSDAHKIYDQNGLLSNAPLPVRIGSKVWIAANCTILKGSVIPDGVVVSCNTLVNKAHDTENCILGGTPAKVIKHISGWEI